MPVGFLEHHKLRDQMHIYKYLTIISLFLVTIFFAFIRPFAGIHLVVSGFLVMAVWLQTRIPFAIRSALKEQINTGKIPVQICLEVTEAEVSIATAQSNGAFLWECLVDFKICKTGILLYPQKNIFYWIPNSATIEDGTWQDFEALISKKITRKI